MNEEEVSVALFRAALKDPALDLLSWQSVDGKGYFAADIKIRLLSGQRMEPDLIACDTETVWVVELKAAHSDAQADEAKLVTMLTELGAAAVLDQIRRRIRDRPVPDQVKLVVCYAEDDFPKPAQCFGSVAHLAWIENESRVASIGLASVLRAISSLKK